MSLEALFLKFIIRWYCEIRKDFCTCRILKKYFIDIHVLFYIFVALLIPGFFHLTLFSQKRIQPNVIFKSDIPKIIFIK